LTHDAEMIWDPLPGTSKYSLLTLSTLWGPDFQSGKVVPSLCYKVVTQSGPTSQDAETPSHSGYHPPHLLYNRRGLTRNNSEFRRPEMWAQDLLYWKYTTLMGRYDRKLLKISP
jgi:hypothetical protein